MVSCSDIFDICYDEFIDTQYTDDNDMAKRFTQIIGVQARCFDTNISDGVLDDTLEDRYVMKSSFDFKDLPIVIRLYYGDVTREIVNIETYNC